MIIEEAKNTLPSMNTYLESEDQILPFKKAGFKEVILEPRELSRMGRLKLDESIRLARIAVKSGLSPILSWDILMTENIFQKVELYLKDVPLEIFSAIRVQDPGAVEFLKSKYPDIPIHLILETGHHNFESISGWIEHLGVQLKRIVLSLELPKKTLQLFLSKIPCETELLGLGRILLFYTPRNLLSPSFSLKEEFIEVTGASSETPHKDFPIIENRHGTFMYHPKGHNLLEHASELKGMGLNFLRFDLRGEECIPLLEKVGPILRSGINLSNVKDYFSQKCIQGFFKANKSDVLFKKLKNHRIQRKDENYLGEVVEVVKKNYVAVLLKNPKENVSLNDELEFKTPEGRVKTQKAYFLRNALLEDVEMGTHGEVVFVPHMSALSVRTAVYKKS
ncbi:MAG: U32 family peptidase [Bdellovibrionota bacterium]|nr:U32 family peptidase [Bdellovibrionota bacterium]